MTGSCCKKAFMNKERKRHRKAQQKRQQQQKKKQRENDTIAVRRLMYNRILSTLDLNEYVSRLPKSLLSAIFNTPWSNISIDISDVVGSPVGKDAKEFSEYIKTQYYKQSVMIDGKEFSLIDFGILHILRDTFAMLAIETKPIQSRYKLTQSKALRDQFGLNAISQEKQESLNETNNLICVISNRLNSFVAANDKAFVRALLTIIYEKIAQYFNYRGEFIYPIIHIAENRGKLYPVVTIKKHTQKQIMVQAGQESRRAYRCITTNPQGIVPIVWEPGTIGNTERLEVYIQDHAITRLIERLDIDPIGWVYDCLGRSLLDPIISGESGYQSRLVEYRYFTKKLGYLVVTPENNNIALIRSFKFITMTGTPEFYALKSKLKGSREDFEYLGLDTLDILLNSDIQNDKQLRQIFEDCGLGHLFDIQNTCENAQPKLIADEIKRYFQI